MIRRRLCRTIIVPLVTLGLTVACSPQDDQTPGNQTDLSAPIIANDEGVPENVGGGTSATAQPDTPGTAAERENTDRIPVALRGRWGLVAADCTSRHGDAKGLLEISDTSLTFYESRAMLRDFIQWSPTGIRAEFDFSGEGMNWEREMSLTLKDEGRTLIRRDYGEDAPATPLTYRRCAA